MRPMEFRAWITVPGLPFDAEERWEPFIGHLEREHAEHGPILGWDGDVAHVVVSMDARSDSAAARQLCAVVGESLRAVGLGDVRPSVASVEPVSLDEPGSAAAA